MYASIRHSRIERVLNELLRDTQRKGPHRLPGIEALKLANKRELQCWPAVS
jgi:O-succinylbenzoate synthase